MNILIIDDDYVTQLAMTNMLSQYGNCETAEDGEEAIAAFRQALSAGQPYDLITIDIDMPGLNGIEVLDFLINQEKKSRLPHAKKIMVSAKGSPKNVVAATRSHCDAFLVKPVRKHVILKKLIELGLLDKDTIIG